MKKYVIIPFNTFEKKYGNFNKLILSEATIPMKTTKPEESAKLNINHGNTEAETAIINNEEQQSTRPDLELLTDTEDNKQSTLDQTDNLEPVNKIEVQELVTKDKPAEEKITTNPTNEKNLIETNLTKDKENKIKNKRARKTIVKTSYYNTRKKKKKNGTSKPFWLSG